MLTTGAAAQEPEATAAADSVAALDLPADVADISTPYVKVPGLVSGACQKSDGFHYVSVEVNAGDGPRADGRTPRDLFSGVTRVRGTPRHQRPAALHLP